MTALRLEDFQKRLSALPTPKPHLTGTAVAADGVKLNYRTRHRPAIPVDSLILLAPYLGFRAGLDKPGAPPFAQARTWPFLLNAFSGGRLGGDLPAVAFDHGDQISDIGLVASYTVNMALAVTPYAPRDQIGALGVPTWVAIAGDDEILDADKTSAYFSAHAPLARQSRLDGASHLGILLDAGPFILSALTRTIETR